MLLKIETAKPIKEGCYLGIQSGSSRCFTRGDDGPYAQRLPKNFALFLLACSIFCTLFSLSLRAQYYRTRERERRRQRGKKFFAISPGFRKFSRPFRLLLLLLFHGRAIPPPLPLCSPLDTPYFSPFPFFSWEVEGSVSLLGSRREGGRMGGEKKRGNYCQLLGPTPFPLLRSPDAGERGKTEKKGGRKVWGKSR